MRYFTYHYACSMYMYVYCVVIDCARQLIFTDWARVFFFYLLPPCIIAQCNTICIWVRVYFSVFLANFTKSHIPFSYAGKKKNHFRSQFYSIFHIALLLWWREHVWQYNKPSSSTSSDHLCHGKSSFDFANYCYGVRH